MKRREALMAMLGGVVSPLFTRTSLFGQEPMLEVSCDYGGTINDQPLRGKGRGSIDASGRRPHDVTVVYDALPEEFHPYAVGACFITIGVAGATRRGKALNLWDLSRGNYSFERTMTWSDFPDSRIGIKAQVTTRERNFHLRADYEGRYDGPTDLSTVQLWEGIMTQAGDNVNEVGRAVIERSNGKTFEVKWSSVYRGFYRRMNVPRQHASMTADILTFVKNEMRMKWTSDVRDRIPDTPLWRARIPLRVRPLFLLAGLIGLLSVATRCAIAQTSDPKEVSFQAADGVTLYADLYETDDMIAPIVLLFHQAGSNARAEYGSIVPRLIESGYNVLAVDQRSGGTRLGGVNRTASALEGASPSYCDAYPDLEAALAFVIATGFEGPRVVWGSSYSAALVIRLAAEHPDDVHAVLAFSPASGDPMGACKPGPFLENLETPILALRPASEMENPRVRAQLETFQELGHATYVAENGVHGSSMLNPERVEGSVEETWTAVEEFLAQVESTTVSD